MGTAEAIIRGISEIAITEVDINIMILGMMGQSITLAEVVGQVPTEQIGGEEVGKIKERKGAGVLRERVRRFKVNF